MAWGRSSGFLAELEPLLRPVVESCGVVWWGCEWVQERSTRILRLYIDAVDVEKGITVDECAEVSSQVSPLLDVEDIVPGEYSLEVSSPGMERPFFSLPQCGNYCGEVLRLALRQPVAGLRKMQGQLQSVESDALVILLEDGEVKVPEAAIHKAKLWPFQ
jgi:ribosome maturation factor RimP